MNHNLKTIPRYFREIPIGKKKFEIRKDDRKPSFKENDTLILKEYNPYTIIKYSGREILCEVTYVLRTFPGLKKGYCILGIRVLHQNF